jgi:hypothetical protein
MEPSFSEMVKMFLEEKAEKIETPPHPFSTPRSRCPHSQRTVRLVSELSQRKTTGQEWQVSYPSTQLDLIPSHATPATPRGQTNEIHERDL